MRAALRWAILLGVPFAVRAAVHLQLRGDPFYENLFVDARLYHEVARLLAQGAPPMSAPHWQPPFYPQFVAWIYALVGPDPDAVRWVQIGLGSGTCALVFSITRQLAGGLAGWFGWVMAALAGPLVFFDLQLLPATLAGFLLLSTLRLVIAAPNGGAGRRPARRAVPWIRGGLAGALAGAGAITVGNLALLFPLALVLFLWDRVRGRERFWLDGPSLLVFLLVGAAPILWTTVQNHRASGELLPISYNGGINLWIGNNPDYDATVAIRPGREWSELTAEPLRAGATGFRAQSDYFVAKTLDGARAHPGAALRLLGRKTALLLRGDEIPRNTELYPYRASSWVLAALLWVGPIGFPTGILLPLGIAGILLAVVPWGRGGRNAARSEPRSTERGSWPFRSAREREIARRLAIVVAVYGASIVIFFITSRYRAPLLPLFAVFAGVAGTVFLHPLRRLARGGGSNDAAAGLREGGREPGAAGPAPPSSTGRLRAGAAGVAVALVLLGRAGLPPMSRVHGSDTQYDLGHALQAAGDVDGAIRQYELALSLDPENAEAHNNLAGLLLRRGELEGARVHLEAALRGHPSDRALRFNLARVHLSREDPYSAGRLLTSLLAEDPRDERVRSALADAERMADALDEEVGMADPERWLEDLRIRGERAPEDGFLEERIRRFEERRRIARTGTAVPDE